MSAPAAEGSSPVALIAVDPDYGSKEPADSDSQYDSGNESATTSITSSILKHKFENGRRYHAYREGKYAFPNDETEQDRLDLMHHIYTLMLGGALYEAPLSNPTRILDIGTGTGIWAVDMADAFPAAEVIGTDLSPIQPSWVPPNVQFLLDDAESDWMFENDSFDMVHVRGLVGAIKDWPKLLKNAYSHIKPGGWIEMYEVLDFEMTCHDGTYKGSSLERYYSLVERASKITGRSLSIQPPGIMESWLTDAGFKLKNPVTETILPLGTWPADKKQKELGRWAAVALETGFEAYGMALLTRVLEMSVEEFHELVAKCKKEVKSRSVHCYCIVVNYVAQRPEAD